MENVYLIYDIGKTNKKLFVFDEHGKVLEEYSVQFEELHDEDGFPCDDIERISRWTLTLYNQLKSDTNYRIKGINFATYGASFVHINDEGKILTPLYNYLKPLPEQISKQFLQTYFDNRADYFAFSTASPFMGMLNSGLQLYWLKHTQPHVWQKIKYSLHLPQYLHFLFTQKASSDYTSIGCHTGLYDIQKKKYHSWVFAEKINEKLATSEANFHFNTDGIPIGTGLHDSSAALIPYLEKYKEPFILISTGTWCIHLNPFNTEPLTAEELSKDCLCYLKTDGNPVKASRIFLGKEHEMQCKKIAAHFHVATDFFKTATFEEVNNSEFVAEHLEGTGPQPKKQIGKWNLAQYRTANQAYNGLMQGLTNLQKESLLLVDDTMIKTFYIDGGFAANALYVHYLQKHFPNKKVEVVAFNEATALGTFLHSRSIFGH